uniref:Uncharacterized protein n=1 Tax=Zea mays TaxID=4577 RepID=B4FDB8_MAIZE|nr:unknown [Zea mays]
MEMWRPSSSRPARRRGGPEAGGRSLWGRRRDSGCAGKVDDARGAAGGDREY